MSKQDLSAEARGHRRWAWAVAVVGVLGFAWLAVLRGQDANWDLQNYHRYAPYAWLNDRLKLDLAPVGVQSYFNPALDLLIWPLQEYAPPRYSAALIAAIQGLSLLFALLIGRRALPSAPWPVSLLLAAAGVIAPAMWGAIGNTMGDGITATLVLAGLWACLRALDAGRPAPGAAMPPGTAAQVSWRWLIGAGVLLGAAVGFKLTNTCPVLGVGLACLVGGRSLRASLPRVAACLFGGGLIGFAISGGWFHYTLWVTFGNPVFPAFGSWFRDPLVATRAMIDQNYLPGSPAAALVRPFVMGWDWQLVTEQRFIAPIWPWWSVSVVAGVTSALALAWRRWRSPQTASADRPAPHPVSLWTPAQRVVVAFTLFATSLWVVLFGIYRYAVSIEVMLPLAIALLWGCRGRPWRWVLLTHGLVACIVTSLAVPMEWGHARWNKRAFVKETSFHVEGRRPVVLMGSQPIGWVIPFMPAHVAFIGIGSNFPEGPGFLDEVARRLAPADAVYLLVAEPQPGTQPAVAPLLPRLGLTLQDRACRREVGWIGRQPLPFQLCRLR